MVKIENDENNIDIENNNNTSLSMDGDLMYD